jgi:hypothetical protein
MVTVVVCLVLPVELTMSVTLPTNGCGPEVSQIRTLPGLPTVGMLLLMMSGGEPGIVDVTVIRWVASTLFFRKTWTSPWAQSFAVCKNPELALTEPVRVVARTTAMVAAIEKRRFPVLPLRELSRLSVHRWTDLNGEGLDIERSIPRDIETDLRDNRFAVRRWWTIRPSGRCLMMPWNSEEC